MDETQSVHRRWEILRAAPPDPRIRQVRGPAALELARRKDYVLEVDVAAWRRRTGFGSYDNHWNIKADTADLKKMLHDGFIGEDLFLNLGVTEQVEDALVLELFNGTESEEDGYRSGMGLVGYIRIEPLIVGALLSRCVVREALVRLTKQKTLEVLNEALDPIDLDNAYRYADISSEPPLKGEQVATLYEHLKVDFLDDDALKVVVRFLQITLTEDAEAELAAHLGKGSSTVVRVGSIMLALAARSRRSLEREHLDLMYELQKR